MSTQSIERTTSVLLKKPAASDKQGGIAAAMQAIAYKLNGLCQPACPSCHRRALVCCYSMPKDYTEVAPKYYQCSSCSSCFTKTRFSPWVSMSAEEMSRLLGDGE